MPSDNSSGSKNCQHGITAPNFPQFVSQRLLQALLKSSEVYHSAKSDAAKHGVIVDSVSVDLDKMMGQKDKAVDGLTKGIEFLFKKNKVGFCTVVRHLNAFPPWTAVCFHPLPCSRSATVLFDCPGTVWS